MSTLVFELRLYDLDGNRQPLPDQFILAWNYEVLNYGGYGNGSLTLAAQQDDQQIPALPQMGWRWEIWYAGVPAYRGWIELQRPPITTATPNYIFESVGLMGRCSSLLVNASFARPYGCDVSEVYSWLAQEFMQGNDRLPLFTQAIANPAGYYVDRVDFFGQTLKQALDNLSEAAQDVLIWGFDMTPDGTDRFYVQPQVNSLVNNNNVLVIGREITELEDSQDLAQMANAVLLTGGPSRAPNLCYNPSFELPDAPGYGREGNIMGDPSFEQNLDWTYGGNAERKTGAGRPGDYARTGISYAEFGGTGGSSDTIQQSVNLSTADQVAGTPFTLVVHYAAESPGTYSFHVKLEEYNGATYTSLMDQEVTLSSREYQEFLVSKLAIGTSITQLRVTLYDPSTATSEKILIDDIYLYVDDVLVQDGWTTSNYGTGQGLVDWALYNGGAGYENAISPGAYDGEYFIRVSVLSGVDGTHKNSVRIGQTNDHWVSARGKTSFTLRCWVRVAVGQNLVITPMLVREHVTGHVDHDYGTPYTTLGTGEWEKVEVFLNAPLRVRNIRAAFEFGSVGVYDVDAVQLFESGNVDPTTFLFIPSSNVQFYFRADEPVPRTDLQTHASDDTKVKSVAVPFSAEDIGKTLRVTAGTGWTPGDYSITAYDGSSYVTLSASPAATSTTGGSGTAARLINLSAAAQASIATYGLREQAISVPAIVDDVQQSGNPPVPVLAQAITYCTGYLNQFAVPLEQCKVTIDNPAYHWKFVDPNDSTAADQGQFRILGTRRAIADQLPARFVYSLQNEGLLRVEMDLTNRRPDPALLLANLLGSFGDSGSAVLASGAASGSGVGGSVSGPQDLGADVNPPAAQFDLAIHAVSSAQTTNAIPASGEIVWDGAGIYPKHADLTQYDIARIHFCVSSAASQGFLTLQYSIDGGTTWSDMDGSTGMQMPLTSTGNFVSPWVSLAAAAQADILLRGAVGGGTGGGDTADLNSFHAQFG